MLKQLGFGLRTEALLFMPEETEVMFECNENRAGMMLGLSEQLVVTISRNKHTLL